MTDILDIETSTTPRRWKRDSGKTSIGLSIGAISNLSYPHDLMQMTTVRDAFIHNVDGFDTSVKKITKNRLHSTFVHYLNREDADSLQVTGLLLQLKSLIKNKEIDNSILTIFRTLEDWLIEHNLYRVEHFLKSSITEIEWDEDVFIAILSSTLPWKKTLVNRITLYNFVETSLKLSYAHKPNEVKNILSGLK